MTFRLTYEIAHDQSAPGQAARVIRVDLECEPASEDEVREAVSAFLAAVTGERETLRRDTVKSKPSDGTGANRSALWQEWDDEAAKSSKPAPHCPNGVPPS